MISIVVPLYNKRDSIERTMESLYSQQLKDYEIIVVDDGSSDGSDVIVKNNCKSNIYYFRKENGGVSSARNYGIEQSHGEWFFFLDADDELTKGALSYLDSLVRKFPEFKLFVGGVAYRDNPTYQCEKVVRTRTPFFDIWRNKFLPTSGNMLIHRSLIEKYGSFDERMSFFEDYEFPLRMMLHQSVVYTNRPIRIYHQEYGGLSSTQHEISKDMAFYLPEQISKYSFWGKMLWYENLKYMLNWNSNNSKNYQFYLNIEQKYFNLRHEFLHNIRQKMVNHGMI